MPLIRGGVLMPVDGVSSSEAVRTERIQSNRRAEEMQARGDRNKEERLRATEKGRGENMDVTA